MMRKLESIDFGSDANELIETIERAPFYLSDHVGSYLQGGDPNLKSGNVYLLEFIIARMLMNPHAAAYDKGDLSMVVERFIDAGFAPWADYGKNGAQALKALLFPTMYRHGCDITYAARLLLQNMTRPDVGPEAKRPLDLIAIAPKTSAASAVCMMMSNKNALQVYADTDCVQAAVGYRINAAYATPFPGHDFTWEEREGRAFSNSFVVLVCDGHLLAFLPSSPAVMGSTFGMNALGVTRSLRKELSSIFGRRIEAVDECGLETILYLDDGKAIIYERAEEKEESLTELSKEEATDKLAEDFGSLRIERREIPDYLIETESENRPSEEAIREFLERFPPLRPDMQVKGEWSDVYRQWQDTGKMARSVRLFWDAYAKEDLDYFNFHDKTLMRNWWQLNQEAKNYLVKQGEKRAAVSKAMAFERIFSTRPLRFGKRVESGCFETCRIRVESKDKDRATLFKSREGEDFNDLFDHIQGDVQEFAEHLASMSKEMFEIPNRTKYDEKKEPLTVALSLERSIRKPQLMLYLNRNAKTNKWDAAGMGLMLPGRAGDYRVQAAHAWENELYGTAQIVAGEDFKASFTLPFWYVDKDRIKEGEDVVFRVAALGWNLKQRTDTVLEIAEGSLFEDELKRFLAENPNAKKEDFPPIKVDSRNAVSWMESANGVMSFVCPLGDVAECDLLGEPGYCIKLPFATTAEGDVLSDVLMYVRASDCEDGYRPQKGDSAVGVVRLLAKVACDADFLEH